MMNSRTIVINTDAVSMQTAEDSEPLYITRQRAYTAPQGESEVSIFVLGYQRVDKTRKCVESILRNTTGTPYRLYLIDSGSSESLYQYYETVKHPEKTIVRITKNVSGLFAIQTAMKLNQTRYCALVSNDVIVTKNWLSNLLACLKSDLRIGCVSPVSTNVSNLQEENLGGFHSDGEMLRKAAAFNVSNPCRWEERLRLISILWVLRREAIDSTGYFDVGFRHDFGEDDYSLRLRRAGYKLILCKDTFVHHDHDYRNLEDKDAKVFKNSLISGRRNFSEKYFGLDAWDDILLFELMSTSLLEFNSTLQNTPQILGVDVRGGQGILDIQNFLRANGCFQFRSSAFTTQAKYYYDLQSVCDGSVSCDRMEFLHEYFPVNSFDFVLLGEPVNMYQRPVKILEKLLELTKKGGQILLKLRNTLDIKSFLYSIGLNHTIDQDMPIHFAVDDFLSCIQLMNVQSFQIKKEPHNFTSQTVEELKAVLNEFSLKGDNNEVLNELLVKNYIFHIVK